MSEFNPQISSNLGDNYTTRSQGSTPNKALGLLFGAVGDAIGQLTAQKAANKAKADDAMKEDIGGQVNSIISDPLIPSTGNRHVGGAGSEPENFGEMPDELKSTGQQIARMRTANNQGSMSDVDYAMKLDVLAKRMRLKYGNKADAIIQQYANASTANQLRVELNKQAQADAASASDSDKRRVQLLKEHEDFLTDPEVMTDYKRIAGKDFNPQDYDETAFIYAVSGRKGKDAAKARRDGELASSRLERGDKEALAIEYATKDATQLRDSMTYVGLGSLLDNLKRDPGSVASVEGVQLSNLLEAGSKATPEQKAAIRDIVGRIRFRAEQAGDNLLNGIDAQGNSYAKYIPDQKKRDDIRSIVTSPLDTIEHALTNGETGILNALSNDTKARKDAVDNIYLQRHGDTLKQIEFGKAKYGEKAMNDFFSGADLINGAESPSAQALHNAISLDMIGGKSAVDTLSLLDATGSVGKDGKAVTTAIESTVKFITNPELSKQQASDLALSAFFSDDNKNILEKYARTNPQSLFNTFVSPEMTEKLRGTKAWYEYSRFAYYQAGAILKPIGDQIVDAQTRTEAANISFDEKTKRFTYTQTDKDNQYWAMRGFDMWDRYQAGKGQTAVNTMNSYLDRIQPILDANGAPTEIFLQSFFASDKYKKMEKEGGLLSRMGTTVNDFIERASEGKGSTNYNEGPPSRGPRPISLTPTQKRESLDQGGPHQSIEGHQGKGVNNFLPDQINTRSPLVSLLAKAEGADYETMFGGGKHNLSAMTVSQVLDLQKQNVKSAGGSPAGAFQVTDDTLRSLVKAGVVSLNEKFTPQTQDRIAHALLERRGYTRFISGDPNFDANDFADSLAQEWASLPMRNGKSAYEGKAGNKARISRQELMDLINNLQQ